MNADGTLSVFGNAGAAKPGTTITITFPDGTSATALVAADGSYGPVPSTTPQTSGTITATITDTAGNSSSPTTESYTDSTAPTAPATPIVVANPDGTLSVSGAAGAAEAGSTIKVTFPDGSTGSAVVAANGSYGPINSSAPQTSGNVTVIDTDVAGNTSGPTTAIYTDNTDSTAPTMPATPIVVANPNGTLSVSGAAGAAEAGSTIKITFPDGSTGSAVVAANGSYGPINSSAPQTSGTVSAIATDAAGNASTPATGSYTDSTAPITPATPIVVANPNGTLSVSGAAGAAEAGSTIKITFPDGSTGSAVVAADGSYGPINSSAPQTSGTVTAIATDAAGNASTPATGSYTDSTAPITPATPIVVANPNGTLSVSGAAGAAEAGSTIKVTFPDGSTGSAVVAADGSYGPISSSAPQTSGSVSAIATDAAGNASTPATGSYTDSTAPTAPATPIVVANPNGTLSVSGAAGAAEAGSTIKVTFPDGSTGSAVVAADGSYGPINSSAPQTSGTVSAIATDAAGNASTPATGSYTDSTAPITPATPIVVANPNGTLSVSGAAGAAEAGSTIKITFPDGSTGSAVVAADGSYGPINSSAPQTSGTVTAIATDAAGNASTPATGSYTDSTAPITPATPIVVANPNGTLSVSGAAGAAEAGSTIKVTFPDGSTGSAVVAADGSYGPISSSAPQTSGSVSAIATDAAGNASTPATGSYTDSTAPITPATPIVVANPNGTLSVSGAAGAAEAGSTIKITFPDGSTGSAVVAADGSYGPINSSAPQTSGTVTAIATDAAGNASTPATGSYTDSTAPITPATPIVVANPNGTLSVSGAAGAAEAGSTIKVTFPDGSTGSAVVAADGSYGPISSSAPQTSGSVSAIATDAAGNASTPATGSYTDSTAPTAPATPIVVANPNGTLSVSGAAGAAEAGSTIKVTFPDGSTGSAVVAADGSYGPINSSAPQTSGTVSAIATDAAGNASTPATGSYTDSTAPITPATPIVVANPNGTLSVSGAAGAAEAGSTIKITFPDGSTGSAVVAADGSYGPINSSAPQTSGTVTAIATDAAGNASTPATGSYTDSTAPITPATPIVVANPNGTLSVSGAAGAAEAGSTIKVTFPDGSTGSAVVAADGSYGPISSSAPQTSGSVSAIATDAAGNASTPATGSYTDSTAPTAPATPIVVANPNGTLSVSGTAGAAEAGSTIKVTFPDGSTGSAVVAADGSYGPINSSAPQTSGTVSAIATDAAGNASTPATGSYTDSTAPTAPATPIVVANPNGTLSVSGAAGAAEAGSTIKITFPDGSTGSAVVAANGSYGPISSSAPQTSGTVTAIATDAAGNASTPATGSYTDSTAPITPATPIVVANPNGTLSVSGAAGAAEAGSTIKITFPDGSTGSAVVAADGSYGPISSSAPQTSGSVSAIATDAAGNASTPATGSYTDSTAPTAPATPIVVANPNGTLSVSGTAGAAEAGSTIKVTFPDGSTGSALVAADGSYGPINSSAPQTSGTVSAIATDAAGNASTPATESYTDSTAPTMPATPIVVANPNGTLSVSGAAGAAEAGSTIKITFPDGSTGSAVVAANGSYGPISSSAPQTSGTVTAIATDAAGNASTPATGSYTDSTAPITPATPIVVANPNGTLSVSGAAGAAEAGSTIKITFPDGSTGSAVVAADGSYGPISSSAPQTSGSVSAIATDAAGNASTPATGSYTDSTAPTAPATPIVVANPNGTLSVSGAAGAAEAGSTIKVTFPDGSTGSALVAADGSYGPINSSAPQTSGTVSAIATDAAGNASTPATGSYTDSTAPTMPATPIVVANPNGTLSVSGAAGAAEAGSTIKITFPDGSTGSAVVAANGSYGPISSSAPQTSGTVTAIATDAAGNASTPATGSYTDSTAPITPATPIVVANPDGTLNVSGAAGAAEAGSTIKVTFPDGSTGSAVVAADGSYGPISSSAPQTSGSVSAIATDAAGNASTPATGSYTDVIPPSATATISAIVTDTGASSSDFVTSSSALTVKITLTGSLGVGENVQVSFDNGTIWHNASLVAGNLYSFDNTANILSPGSYTFVTRVIDAAGNVSTSSNQIVVIDTLAPTASITIDSINNDTGISNDFITGDNKLTLQGTLGTPLVSDESVQISFNNGATWLTANVSGTTWSYDNSANALLDGTYTLQVRVVDLAGNVGLSASQALVVDTVLPSATTTITVDAVSNDSGSSASDFITNDNTLIFSGTLGNTLLANEHVEISLDGGNTWLEASVTGTAWSYDNSASSLNDGTYTLQARVVDTAGNVGQSFNQAIVVDSEAPSSSESITINAISVDTNSGNDFITSDKTLIFSGSLGTSLATGNSVQISLNGGSTWHDADVVGSSWSYDNTANTITDGTYTLIARVVDVAGNIGQLASQTLIVDTSVPTSTITIDAVTTDSGVDTADFITSDNTLLFSGSLGTALASGEGVQISLDGGINWVGASVSGTVWSYNYTGQILSDNTYSVQARVIDAAGNIGSSATQNITVDTSAPTASVTITDISTDTSVSNDFNTSDNTLVFNGTLSAALSSGERVQISIDGGSNWLDATVAGTNWSYDNSANSLTDGTYTIQARVIDTAGNAGAVTNQTVVIDTQAPSASQTLTINSITVDTGLSNNDFITLDHTLLFGGTLGAPLAGGERVELSIDGGSTWLTAAISGTDWSYDNTGNTLADGTYTLMARVIDIAGNIGQTANQTIVIDNVAPLASATITIDSISSDSAASDFITNDNTLIFNGSLGSILASGEGVQISLNGGTTWNNAIVTGNTWSYDNTGTTLADGNYTLQTRVVDTAGNVGQTASQSLTIDTQVPSASATVSIDSISLDLGLSSSDFITLDRTLLFNGSLGAALSGDETVQISVDGTNWFNASVSGTQWSYDNTANSLANGTYNVQARVIDSAGNIGQMTSQTVVIDRTAPIATVAITNISTDTGDSASDFITSDQTLVINVTLSGSLASGEVVQVSFDSGLNWHTATDVGSGIYSYDNTATTLAEGTYTLQTRVSDVAGNISPVASQGLIIDKSAPSTGNSVSITSYTDDSTPQTGDFAGNTTTNDTNPVLNGTVTGLAAGDVVRIYEGLTLLGLAVVSGSTWSYQLNTQAEGGHSYHAVISDAAGNEGTASTVFTLTVDTVAPAASKTITIDSITTDSGPLGDFSTNDNSLIFSGSLGSVLATNEGVQISLDGGVNWLNANVSGTNWSFDNTANTLADSTYAVQARVVDAAGNVGQTASQVVIVDTQAPSSSTTITITAISLDTGTSGSDFATADNTLIFFGSLGQALTTNERVEISLDNGQSWSVVNTTGSSWTYDNTANILPDATYNVQARVIDIAGNVGQTTSRTVVIDSAAPVGNSIEINVITPDNGLSSSDYVTDTGNLSFSGTLSSPLAVDQFVEISFDNGANWFTANTTGTAWSYDNTATTLADGTYNVQARIIDTVGNVEQTATEIMKIDTLAPTSIVSIGGINSDTGTGDDFITSDHTLIFNGSLSATLGSGDGVQISLDGGTTWQNASVSGTTWSYDNTGNSLGDGSYTLQVRVIDVAGNVGSSANQIVVIDSAQPTASVTIAGITTDTGTSSSDFITSDQSLVFNVTLTGTLGSGENVQISLDGGSSWHNASLVSGNTYAYDNSAASLPEGTYTVEARVIDNAGNSSAVATQTVIVDTSGPTTGNSIALTSFTDDIFPLQGNFGGGASTNDTAPVLNGTLSGLALGDIVQVYEGSTLLGVATVSSGSWSFQLGTTSQGSHTYHAVIVDSSGNAGTVSADFTLTVDTTAPSASKTITIGSINSDTGAGNDFITADNTLIFSGVLGTTLASDEGVEFSLDGGTTWLTASVSGTTWSYDNTLNSLTDGVYNLKARVVDAAGNAGNTANQVMVLDTAAPSASETIALTSVTLDTGTSSSDFITADNTLVFSGTLGSTLASGDGVEISLNGGVSWLTASVTGTTWTYDNSGSTMADGSYNVKVRVIDTAGNVGQSDSHTVVIDTTQPSASTTIAITAVSDDTGSSNSDFNTGDNTLIFSGTLGAALVADEGVQISLDGGTTWMFANVSGTTWTYDNTAQTMADGTYNLKARVIDSAGNFGATTNQSLIIDTAGPSASETITISSITTDTGSSSSDFNTSDNTLIFSGTLGTTLASGHKVQISLNGGTAWVDATVSGTNWNYDNTANTLADGSYNVQVRVVDTAGNVGQSANQAVVIDTSAPTSTATISAITTDAGTSGDFVTNDQTLVVSATLTGTLNSGEKVQISLDNGSSWNDATLVSGNTYAYDNSGNTLAAGSYNFVVRVVDAAGNASSTATQAVVIDVTAPAVTAISITAITTDTNSAMVTGIGSTTNSAVNSDFNTRDTLLTVTGTYSGTLVGAETLQISSDGGVNWSNVTFDNVTKIWSFIDSTARTSAVTYQIRAIDSAGNIAVATASQVVTVDTVAPTEGIIAPVLTATYDSGVLGDCITTNTSLTFSSVNSRNGEAGARLVLVNDVNRDGIYSEGIDNILATTTVAADGSWSITASGLSGNYHLSFMQVDSSGNRSRLTGVTDINVVAADNASPSNATWGSSGTYGENLDSGATATLNSSGQWSFLQTVSGSFQPAIYNATSLTAYTPITFTGAGGVVVSATFADFQRTGYAAVVSVGTNAGLQEYWTTTNGSTYTRSTLSGSLNYGAVVAYDKTGDGYLDFAYGDNFGDSISFVTNTNGTLAFMNGTSAGRPTGVTLNSYAEASGVDLDNNGTVDIVEHTNGNGNFALTTFKNDQTTVNTFSLTTIAGVFNTPSAGNTNVPISMTWADFNGDGYMDLYLNTGRNVSNTADSDVSRIYWNNGTGAFGTSAGTAGGSATYFSDALKGGASVAVDWDHDGKMDVIELPAYGVNSSPVWYKNQGGGLFNAGVSLTGATTYSTINGALAVDYNWDGAVDVLLYRSGAAPVFIQNTNTVAASTSLHLRILDPNGLNIFYGNTVQLYDQTGALVASQIINAQSGLMANDSTGIVNFYGLNASNTYTAVLVRSTGGTSNDVGGAASLGGTIENVNTTWTGLTTGSATDAYVLSAEASSNAANGNFVGTGYNDTFFATAGTDIYNGAGGWGGGHYATPVWSATGGEDRVNFKLAGSTGVTVNLNTATSQNTGFNTATFTNIESLVGSSGNDNFTASTTAGVDNVFEGRGGNDTFTVTGGGHATLIYNMITSSDATGGNGSDTVNGFTVGNVPSSASADIIDLTSLLANYTGTSYVYLDATTGKYVLDQASQELNNYLQVSNDGVNTTISVDTQGTGDFSSGHTLLTLNGVVTDLPTLLANNQLLHATPVTTFDVVTINSQSTSDSTPIISGVIPSALVAGSYLEIRVNGIIYSSATGEVVLDPLNNTWYLQVSSGNALANGTYEVSTAIINSSGSITGYDISSSELVITPPVSVTFAGTGSATNKATAITIGDNGAWRLFSNDIIYDSVGSTNGTLGSYASQSISISGQNTQSVTFVDYNRDGYMDIYGIDQDYGNGQTAWTYNGTTYTGFQLTGGSGNSSAITFSWFGGVVAYDKTGDGYVDVVYGDNTPDDSEAGGGYDSQFVINTNGTTAGFIKDGNYVNTNTGTPTPTNFNNAQPDKEVSGVDINNDGTVDIVYHSSVDNNFLTTAKTTTSANIYRLVVVQNSGNGALASSQVIDNVFFNEEGTTSYTSSMTWADFNGDGYLDLFLGRGRTTPTGTVADSDVSRILYNNAGTLVSSTTGGFATTYLGDSLAGGASIAVDWNGDGRMDAIELPRFDSTGTNPINLYTNNGSGSFTTSTLLSYTSAGTTGVLALDLDWNGSKDLLYFGNTTGYISNSNTIAAGSSLHFRLVDANGINAFYGNTVQLINSAGVVVATQIINPQSGLQTNDSSALVDFYGLSSSETYSVVLLRNVGGVSSDVGAVSTVGSNTIENVNSTWGGFKAGEANSGYVLTAETSTNVANANIGNGIIGTGYNDTFFATQGSDIYSGGGGTETISGQKIWSNTGGMDIVDYKLAGSTGLTIDLSNTSAQATGYNTATFKNIEGLAGGSGNDTFTGNSSNNQFEGRGGNDTFNLTHGGKDTLIYNILNNLDNTGGNGSDTVNGFKIGTYEATTNADRIDLSKLLIGYTADADGQAHYINGIATIDSGDNIGNFLTVTTSGSNTLLSIDRDGSGGSYSPTVLVTLNDVNTDLATLLANHQIIVT